MADSAQPISILIAALGGEGGGVLTGWLVDAAMRSDLPVQSISTPGVAQRTGATTYYVEIYPQTNASLDGKRPVLALYPSPGTVDIMVASELIEAGRALENGYVAPDRTILIAATHRIYAVAEKSAMADGRFDEDRVLRAAQELPQRAILMDLTRNPETRSLILNAVLLGAIAGSESLPIKTETFREAIQHAGKMVEANLTAFEYGVSLARGAIRQAEPELEIAAPDHARSLDRLIGQAAQNFPPDTLKTVELGLERTADWHNLGYAKRYLKRLTTILDTEMRVGDSEVFPLTKEVARRLALWMAYEDLIRVADLKTRAERFAKIREEVRAKPDEPVRTREFMKPGVEEVAAMLPGFLARPLLRWAERRNLTVRLHIPMRLTSSGIFGFTLIWLLARMRRFRPMGYRYGQEQAAIEQWLDAVNRLADRSPELALEVARLPRLIKGYSDTHRRGTSNYRTIMDDLVAPLLADRSGDDEVAERLIADARKAALKDPDGDALAQALSPTTTAVAAE
ncbi:MAG: indolepyruvate oxidoreductase subunit beta family protein [Pseudomonadota bacterium]